MAKDFLFIGPVPAEEPCAQLGVDPDFHEKNRAECKRFIRQIQKHYGEEPHGAILLMKAQEHDFGTYREVCVMYDDSNEEAVDYAFRIEADELGVLNTWSVD